MNRMRQIEAFLGCWGVKTKGMTADEIISMAETVFETGRCHYEALAEKIDALGKTKRRELAAKNLPHYGIHLFQKLNKTKITNEGMDRMMERSSPNLINGDSMDVIGELDIDPAALLQKVVTAVINYGHQDILWEFPEVLAYFGSRIPNRGELEGHHKVNEAMFEAKKRWPNLKAGVDL